MGKRFRFNFIALFSAAVLTSCSPGGFFGPDEDGQVATTPIYREPNHRCSAMLEDSASLTVSSARKLVSCMNSDGSLQPLENLIAAFDDSELGVVLETLNEQVLNRPNALYEVEHSYRALEAAGRLDATLERLGHVFEKEEVVASALALLRGAYQSSPETRGEVLKLLAYVGADLSEDRFVANIELVLNLIKSRAFVSLTDKVRHIPLDGSILSQISAEQPVVLSEPVFRALNQIFGSTPKEILVNTARLTAILETGLKDDAKILRGVTALFDELSRPISCMKGTQHVSSALPLVIRELTQIHPRDAGSFIVRTNPLRLAVLSEFCNLPAALGENHQLFVQLAQSTTLEPLAQLLQTLARQGLEELPIKLFTGIRPLFPLLVQMQDHRAWDDLLLLATVLVQEDREKAIALERNYFPGLMSVLRSADGVLIGRFFNSVGEFLRTNDTRMARALEAARASYLLTDAHPFVGAAQRILINAAERPQLLEVLMNASERREFASAVRFLAEMSQSGRIKTLLGTVISVFHHAAERGKIREPKVLEVRPWESRRQHDWNGSDLSRIPVESVADPNNPCFGLDPRRGLEQQLDRIVGCINREGGHQDFAQVIRYLTTETTSSGDRNLFQFHADLMRRFAASSSVMADLSQRGIAALEDGRFYRIMSGLPYWEPVLRPVWDLAGPVLRQSESLDRASLFAAETLKSETLPNVLRYARGLKEAQPAVSEIHDRAPYPIEDLQDQVKKSECEADPLVREERVRQIISDYEESVTSWDLVHGRARRGWNREEFKALLEPLFQKFGDRAQSAPSKPVVQALLNVIRYFDLQSGEKPNARHHYPSGYLAEWFQILADDFQPLLYFYPNEENPRIRLMSSMDRLELVLINADFTFATADNYGQKFLAMIAEAWGDEPRDVWPEPIRQKYPKGKRPPTLREVVDEITSLLEKLETLVAYPSFPECPELGGTGRRRNVIRRWTEDHVIPHHVKAALFNIRQVLPVLYETLPASGAPTQGAIRVLRDLFYELYTSSPEGDRRHDAGWKNNLSVVSKLVRMGLTRQISREIRVFKPGDPELQDFFASFVRAAATYELKWTLLALFQDDREHQVAWAALDQIFDALEKSESDREWAAVISRVKESSFYGIASLARLDHLAGKGASERHALFGPVFRTATSLIQKNRSLILDHREAIEALLVARDSARIARALYSDRDDAGARDAGRLLLRAMSDRGKNPSAVMDAVSILAEIESGEGSREAWARFRRELKEMNANPQYQALRLGDLLEDLYFFIEEDGESARAVRAYLAQLLADGDLREMVRMAARNPEGYHQIFQVLAKYSAAAEVKGFFELSRKALTH